MAEDGISWFYLIFFLIPLARIIPRLVRKLRKGKGTFDENQFMPTSQGTEKEQGVFERQESTGKPQNKEMRVLGELNKGVKDFNKIQKNLGINNQELENILNDLEGKGLMKVLKKGGLLGMKVELYPTDKGFKRYYT